MVSNRLFLLVNYLCIFWLVLFIGKIHVRYWTPFLKFRVYFFIFIRYSDVHLELPYQEQSIHGLIEMPRHFLLTFNISCMVPTSSFLLLSLWLIGGSLVTLLKIERKWYLNHYKIANAIWLFVLVWRWIVFSRKPCFLNQNTANLKGFVTLRKLNSVAKELKCSSSLITSTSTFFTHYLSTTTDPVGFPGIRGGVQLL